MTGLPSLHDDTAPIKTLRFLHGTLDIAWQPTILAHGLRRRGLRCYSLAYAAPAWGPKPDVLLKSVRNSRVSRELLPLTALLTTMDTYDVFHVHYGRSHIYNNLDVPFLRMLGKRFIFHFHGSEIRPQAVERSVREWAPPDHPPPSRFQCWCTARRIHTARAHGAAILVSTPDLLDVIPDAHHLPVALDLDRWSVEPRENTRNATFKIVHAPTDPDFKGTAYLLRAVEVLKAEGHDISLEVLREVPRDDALRRIAGADIFVDQLGVGWYGLAAVEAMALGVPTICHIRDDLAGYLTPLPLITASKMTIESTLRFVLANRDALPDYGSAGRRFVEKHHDSRAVVATLIDIYRRALS